MGSTLRRIFKKFAFFLQLAVAKIMEQGPVLIMTFVAQQTMVVKDTRGNIIEGKEVSLDFIS